MSITEQVQECVSGIESVFINTGFSSRIHVQTELYCSCGHASLTRAVLPHGCDHRKPYEAKIECQSCHLTIYADYDAGFFGEQVVGDVVYRTEPNPNANPVKTGDFSHVGLFRMLAFYAKRALLHRTARQKS